MDTAAAPCYSRFQLWTFAASKLYVKPAVINDVVMVAAVAVVVVVAAVTIVVMMMMMMMVMVMVTGMQI